MSGSTEKTKEILLHFASSELTSHAANTVGFSLMLFGYLTVVVTRFPRLNFAEGVVALVHLQANPKTIFDYVVIFIVFVTLNSGIFFSVMRLVYYGSYTSKLIHHSSFAGFTVNDLQNAAVREIQSENLKFFGIPIKWFEQGFSMHELGFWFSFAVGFFVTVVLFFVLFFQ